MKKFKPQGFGRKKRIKARWRRPRGIDSKKRIQWAKLGPVPKIGWRGPRALRGLHPSGLPEVRVHNTAQLEGKAGVIVRVAAAVGKKKRREIIARAKALGLKVIGE